MHTRRSLLVLAFGAALAPCGEAAAQSRALNVDHLQLALTSGEFLATEGASLAPWTWHAGVSYDFTDEPLLVDDVSREGTRTVALIDTRSLVDATFGVALGRRISLGVDLPVLLAQRGAGVDGGSALGDLKLAGRVTAYRGVETELAAMVALRLPTGATDDYLGEGGVVAEVRAIAGWTRGRVRLAANLGVRLRDARRIVDLTVGPELLASAALGVRAHEHLDLFAEIHVDTSLSDRFFSAAATPLEVLVGATGRVRGVTATAAVGAGLVEGYGDPRVRVLLALGYESARRPLSPSLPTPIVNRRPPAPAAPAPAVAAAPTPAPAPAPAPLEPPAREVDPAEPAVEVTPDLVELSKPIFFDTNRAHVSMSHFEEELRQLARAIEKRPWIRVLWIEGHADSRGTVAFNLDLSRRRAGAVARALVRLGVAPERLRTLGWGETRPWFSNAQQAGRTRNRRVVFLIQRTDGEPAGGSPGNVAVEEHTP